MNRNKLILHEILIFILGSVVLIGIGMLFRNREQLGGLAQSGVMHDKIMTFWDEADQALIESYQLNKEILQSGEGLSGGEVFPIDQLALRFIEDIGNEEISRDVSRLKLDYWNSMEADVQQDTDDPNRTIKKYVKASIYPLRYDDIVLNAELMEELTIRLSDSPYSPNMDSLKTYIDGLNQPGTASSPVQFKDLEILIFISLSIILLTTLVTILSRFIARWLAASYLQDMIRGQGRDTGLRYKLLPYLLSLPAFAPAALFMRVEMGLLPKFLLVLVIMVLAGGLSFELTLKYLELGGREYQKPYVRFLSFYKRDKSRRGPLELLRLIFMPHRSRQLKSSGSVLPFVLTGTDYHLMPHVRRRMCVVVDSYALAGIVLGFTFWDALDKPDLVQMLSETTRSYGASVSLLWMAEAILLGLFVAKIVFILLESRQFTQEAS